MQPDWYGALESDNIAAELTAFIIAQDVAYRLLSDKKVVIRPDLMLSQMIATFDTITKASPNLAQICRVMSRWLGRRVQVNQVSAHKGHPWNELADSLAKWAATSGEVSQVCWHALGFTPWHLLPTIYTGVGFRMHRRVFNFVSPRCWRAK
jgi:ribonuclease HI